ncbi:MAG: substrate-binding domain-containing protein [Chloroflexi bacterium]|nr:substrate-binding domain-containing protein [Chloroflexota bacterium]
MATISDVAKQAGVSPVTVSRVINNAGNVSAATRTRVERAIAELGYVPSGAAQSLRSKRTKTLALIVPDIQNAFWTTMARGIEDAAQSHGYSIFLYNTDENAAKQRHCLEVVVSQRVDGVIIAPHDSNAENLALLRQRDVPTVIIDRHIDDWDVDTVSGDSISASRSLVQHLIKLGHKRIAMISGPLSTSTSTDRIIGYRIALAEAGLPYDPTLVRTGEYRSISGERLTHQLLETTERPTAIFAANNVIALGVIDALDAHGLRVPQDMALVCFDDLPNTSRLFPFLTVAVQPAYDLGANAAQLLLSRLTSERPPPPRHVVLPTRLIIRHSCGSTLADRNHITLQLPARSEGHERVELVKPLSPEELRLVTAYLNDATFTASRNRSVPTAYEKPDVQRIEAALQFRESDRAPHVEFDISSLRLYAYVLGRKDRLVQAKNGSGGAIITPEDRVEFAQRMGLDAILCEFSGQTSNPNLRLDGACQLDAGPIETWADLDQLQKPIAIADHLNELERHLRAAEGSKLGVFVSFDSFFDCALRTAGHNKARSLFTDRFFFARLMDILLERQERVMRAVCDRFADEISFVLVKDKIADETGSLIDLETLREIYSQRMQALIAPAKDHGLPVAIRTAGNIEQLLPLLHSIGFDIIHPSSFENNDLRAYKEAWKGKLVFAGGFPLSTLQSGSQEEITQQVKQTCAQLTSGGGYMFGVSGLISDDISPENFVIMTKAMQKYRLRLLPDYTSGSTRTSPS